MLKETRACRALLFPTPSSPLTTQVHVTEKDQVHPAEMHSQFLIRVNDKERYITLLQSPLEWETGLCDFDS